MKKRIKMYDRKTRENVFTFSFMSGIFTVFIYLNSMTFSSVQIEFKTDANLTAVVEKEQSYQNHQLKSEINLSSDMDSLGLPKVQKMEKYAGEVLTQKDIVSSETKNSTSTMQHSSNERKTKPIQSNSTFDNQTYKKKKYTKVAVNINEKDPLVWQKIYGIGPVLSERIVKFNNWSGGFVLKDQIKDVYGITDSLYQEIRDQLIEDKKYQTIKINTCDVKSLASSPYVSWKDAKKILNYRKQHGPFYNKEDLKKIIGLDEQKLSRLLLYIDFTIGV